MPNDVPELLKFGRMYWPQFNFYDKQREIIHSVQVNDETFSPAGNMLGKDFVAAFAVLTFFLSRHPCRVVTTSADDDHLRVLWGEMSRFIQESRVALDSRKGGQLVVNHREIRKIVKGEVDGLSYIIGRVAAKGEGMQGHHIAIQEDGIPRTMFVADEASGVPDEYYRMADTWAHRKLIIGNPWPCDNFFKYAVKGRPNTSDRGGDIAAPDNNHFYRKVIKIRAEDSPNVRLGIELAALGKDPHHNAMMIPGVLTYKEYLKRRLLWDKIQQCVGLDAEFYEGAEVKLCPPEWLNRAEQIAAKLAPKRTGRAMGVDTAEGGDNTAWAIVDALGLIHLLSLSTPDTSVIVGRTLALMREYGVPAENVLFDAGGGGKQHADRLRQQGYKVRAVAFGGSATPARKRGLKPIETRTLEDEIRYVYKNRRAEMYGAIRLKLDPAYNSVGFGMPAQYAELRRQLQAIPLTYDEEGRLELPPKTKRDTPNAASKVCLVDLIGRSPDEADALALAVFGLVTRRQPAMMRVG